MVVRNALRQAKIVGRSPERFQAGFAPHPFDINAVACYYQAAVPATVRLICWCCLVRSLKDRMTSAMPNAMA